MRVRIKTKEQLIATPGVSMTASGEFLGPDDYFTERMMKYCGKKIDLGAPHGNRVSTEIGTISEEENWCFRIHDWMVVDPKGDDFNELYNKLNGN